MEVPAMEFKDWVILAGITTTMVGTVSGIIISWRGSNAAKRAAEQAKEAAAQSKDAVQKLEVQVNSRLSQLIAALGIIKLQEGKEIGRNEAKDERLVSDAKQIVTDNATVTQMDVETLNVGTVKPDEAKKT